MAMLNNINLGNGIQWTDRYSQNAVSQTVKRTLAGSVVVYHGSRTNGLPITLESGTDYGWVKKAVLDEVKQLANSSGVVMELEINGEHFNVMFAHQNGNALEATPIMPYANPTDDSYYRVKLNLITL